VIIKLCFHSIHAQLQLFCFLAARLSTQSTNPYSAPLALLHAWKPIKIHFRRPESPHPPHVLLPLISPRMSCPPPQAVLSPALQYPHVDLFFSPSRTILQVLLLLRVHLNCHNMIVAWILTLLRTCALLLGLCVPLTTSYAFTFCTAGPSFPGAFSSHAMVSRPSRSRAEHGQPLVTMIGQPSNYSNVILTI
jgi:hypothetical protein